MSKLNGWPLLFALWLGVAGAARTAAPTPLFATPTLSGQAALTLPAGKPLMVVEVPDGPRDGQTPVTVIYGGKLYYTRFGLLGSDDSPLSFRDGTGYFSVPQSASRSVTVPLLWEGEGAADLDWQVSALPLAEPKLGGSPLALAGSAVRTVNVKLRATGTEGKKTRAAGQVELGRLPAGLYLLTASRPDAPATVLGTEVIRVSDLHLTSLASPRKVRVWATHAVTGAVLPGVRLSGLAVTRSYEPVADRETVTTRPLSPVTTDEQGLASFNLRDGENLVVLGQGRLDGQMQTARLGGMYDEYWLSETEHARALIQTDKPVYRPGETLRGLAVLRQLTPGQRLPYRAPGDGTVTVRLVSLYSSLTLAQQKVKPDADGLVRFSFALPDSVKTGSYSVQVELPRAAGPDNPRPTPDVSSMAVEVRAFVKPLFTLDLSGPQEIVSGTDWPLTARTELYQGGPANVSGEGFLSEGSPSENLYDSEMQQGDDSLFFEEFDWAAGGTSLPAIDPKRRPDFTLRTVAGRATLPLSLRAEDGLPTFYQVTVRSRDEYGRDVWATRSVTVHPAALKFENARVSGPEELKRVTVQVRQVGTDKPLPGRKVTVTAVRSYRAAGPGGSSQDREERLFEKTLTTDAQGRIAVSVPTPMGKEGEYTLTLAGSDSTGRRARARLDVAWVSGRDEEEKRSFSLSVSTDQETYAPGSTATVRVKTDLPVGTPLLLGASAEDRSELRVVKVTGPTMNVPWQIGPTLEPAFTVQAVAIRQGEFVQGSTDLLFVPRRDQQLNVTVTPQGEVRPGEKATFTIRTTRAGKGVSALTTLSAVNESVYAVVGDPTPHPWRFFWGATYPQIEVRSSQMMSDDGRGGGGGGDDGALYRSDLREVAAFQTVQTDASGNARVTVTMPEALGSYRLSVRALTRSGAAGEAKGVQRVGLPFAVRLIRPRVLTQGDTGSVVVGAVDRNGKGGNVTLSLTAGGAAQTKTLPLQGGSATQTFRVQAPSRGQALPLQASAARGSERDGIREDVPLRPAGQRLLLSGSGTLKGAASVPLKWDSGARPESLIIDLAASPLQLALSGLDAALSDPEDRWVTTDGFSARLTSNLHLAALAGQFGWPDMRERALAQARRDFAGLLALQGQDGWGWTESSEATADMTALALLATVQAKGAGLTHAQTLREVQQAAQGWADKPTPLLAAALAQAGAPQVAVRLARQGVSDPADAARLASVLASAQPPLAATLYDRARKAARSDKDGALVLGSAASWQGDSEPTALLLEAAARLNRTADLPALTRAVLERRTGSAWSGGGGGWGGPRATAASIQAIRVLAAREGKPQPRPVTVKLGRYQKTVTVSAPVRLTVPAQQVQAGTLSLQAAAPTPYAWELRLRRNGSAPAALSPVKIERRYDKTTVGRDGIVTVTLTFSTPSRLTHLRVTDPLPGGLEAIDDSPLFETATVNVAGSNRTAWADRALYDDRAVFYLEDLKPGTTTIRYRLRALAAGDYAAPAPRVDFASGAAPAEGSGQVVKVTDK